MKVEMGGADQTTAERRSALVVVDMQNAFVSPAAGRPVEGADRVLQAVNGCVAQAVERGWPVFYTQDVAPFDMPAQELAREIELHEGLDVRGRVVPKGPGRKGGFSGFLLASSDRPGGGALSPLAELLVEAHVDEVVVVGLAADVCVAATARDARRLGLHVTVPLAATAFVHAHPGGDEAAIDDLRAAGVTVVDQPVLSPH